MNGVIGIDEVGRGPLAGPVTVCAVYIEDETTLLRDIFQNTIRDSKKINKSLRNNIYQTIRYNRYSKTRVEYAVYSRSAAFIDKYGIQRAIRHCVKSCVKSLKKKGIDITLLPVRLDAGLTVPFEGIQQESFIKGDEKYVEIALASILAKEHRDAYMRRISARYKGYLWESNAGYGTKDHKRALEMLGPTKHHRLTYLKGFKLLDKTNN